MSYCVLSESQVIDQLRDVFNSRQDLKDRSDLGYFYSQLDGMTKSNIEHITDKVVKFGRARYNARLVARRENPIPGEPTVIEQFVTYTVYACNDLLFATVNADRYYYSPTIGDDRFDYDEGVKLGQDVAAKIYAAKFVAKGYSLTRVEILDWAYEGKGVETYTEYIFRYQHNGTWLYDIKGVGYGDKISICNLPVADADAKEETPAEPEPEPEPEPKKRRVWPWVLIGIIAVAAIAICIAYVLLS